MHSPRSSSRQDRRWILLRNARNRQTSKRRKKLRNLLTSVSDAEIIVAGGAGSSGVAV